MRPADVPRRIDEIRATYEAHGVVIFPGMLAGEPALQGFLRDLRYLFERVLARHGQALPASEDLGDALVRLKGCAALDGRIIADIGTQPNKLLEANRLKYSDLAMQLVRMAFGEDAVIASPAAGDTLHLFMPGEEFHRYNLPVHQDYQYLMQSPRQATPYVGLSQPHPGVGGLEYWPGSQRLGVLKSGLNANGSFEVVDAERLMAQFPTESYAWEVGDVSLFDSLMCHRSIPNSTPDRGRIVQIFRYSDLRDAVAETFDWQSTTYPRRGVSFQDTHPELFAEDMS